MANPLKIPKTWPIVIVAVMATSIGLIINGSAILTGDTAGYIANGHRGFQMILDMIEHVRGNSVEHHLRGQTFGAQRSIFYGFMTAVLYQIGGFRLVAFMQGCWSSFVLARFMKMSELSGLSQILIAAAVLTLTPFVIFDLVPIPDFAAAPMILGLALCITDDGSMSRGDQLFWLANVVVAILFHNSLVLIGAVIVGGWQIRLLFCRPRRYMGPILPAVLGSAVLAVTYPTLIERLSGMSDATPPFLLGRMIGDGNAARVLDDDCAQEHWFLCRYRTVRPLSSDDFLFSGDLDHDSPAPGFNKLDVESQRRVKNEATVIILRTIQERGTAEIISTAKLITQQMFNLDLGLFEQSDSQIKSFWKSSLTDAYLSFHSYFYNHNKTLGLMSGVYTVVYVACLPILLGVIVIRRARQRSCFDRMERILICLWVSVTVNAVVCAGLSGNFGRFQARVVWPIVAVSLIVLVRSLSGSRYQPLNAQRSTSHPGDNAGLSTFRGFEGALRSGLDQ